MEAARTSETLVRLYQTTRCYNPEDSHLHTHRRENLKSYVDALIWFHVIHKSALIDYSNAWCIDIFLNLKEHDFPFRAGHGHTGQNSQRLNFSRGGSVAPVEVTRRLSLRHVQSDLKSNPVDIRNVVYCDDDVNSMLSSMCCVFLVAQVFALCPVRGIAGRRAEDLRFVLLFYYYY
jgi:hypothetical protein